MLDTGTIRKLYELQCEAQYILKTTSKIERKRRECLEVVSSLRTEEALLNSYPEGTLSPREWKRARDDLRASKATLKKRWQESEVALRKLKTTFSHMEKRLTGLRTLMKEQAAELSNHHINAKSELESTIRLIKVAIARIGIQEL